MEATHPDDQAVDAFATAMKAKLAKSRAAGRGGWEDKQQCTQMALSMDLRVHVLKGDPVDVANFAMMLFNRGESICRDMPMATHLKFEELTKNIDAHLELEQERRAAERRREPRPDLGRRSSDPK